MSSERLTDKILDAERAKRSERNRLAEAFIRGIETGAEEPTLAGDGDAMYEAFQRWVDNTQRLKDEYTQRRRDE